jgi:acetoin utilization deacetylase AcuC-like enzyme
MRRFLTSYNRMTSVVHIFHNREAMSKHIAPVGFPERSARLDGVHDALENGGLFDRCASHHVSEPLDRAVFIRAYGEPTVHAWEEAVGRATVLNRSVTDKKFSDTIWSAGSLAAVGVAAAASIRAVETVLAAPDVQHAFAIVRPPGHHCFQVPAGFCIANNVCLAAQVALDVGKRVAIIDWDYHFGDGTAETFLTNPNVFFTSLHCATNQYGDETYPSHPLKADALAERTGGRMFNIMWDTDDADDAAYSVAFRQVICPALTRFGPDLILISAGYDALQGDSLAGMQLSTGIFLELALTLKQLDVPIVCVLEGGYSPALLGRGVASTIAGLLRPLSEAPHFLERRVAPHHAAVIQKTARLIGLPERS